jgi:hypothetical protein
MTLIHCFDTSADARFLRGRGAPLMMSGLRYGQGANGPGGDQRRRGLSERYDKCGEAAWQELTFDIC